MVDGGRLDLHGLPATQVLREAARLLQAPSLALPSQSHITPPPVRESLGITTLDAAATARNCQFITSSSTTTTTGTSPLKLLLPSHQLLFLPASRETQNYCHYLSLHNEGLIPLPRTRGRPCRCPGPWRYPVLRCTSYHRPLDTLLKTRRILAHMSDCSRVSTSWLELELWLELWPC